MRVEFDEEFGVPTESVYPCFRDPSDWPRLFPAFTAVEERGGGWYGVRLHRFPIALVGRITQDEPLRRVAWTFGAPWRGEGSVEFVPTSGGVIVRGFEQIHLRGVPEALERWLFQRRFEAVWEAGWRRLRRQAQERKNAIR